MSDETARSFFQGTPEEDERFKYRVIEGLAESIRQLTTQMADLQRTQVGMLERLASLEANKFADAIASVKGDVKILMIERDRREGAFGMLAAIKSWSPFIAAIMATMAAAWLYGRSIGIVPAPPVKAQQVEATIGRDDRTIQGTVSPQHDGR
jgi:hypothetical protein